MLLVVPVFISYSRRDRTRAFSSYVDQDVIRLRLQGLWPNYIKVVPSIAIAFVTYEKLKEGLGVELRISS